MTLAVRVRGVQQQQGGGDGGDTLEMTPEKTPEMAPEMATEMRQL